LIPWSWRVQYLANDDNHTQSQTPPSCPSHGIKLGSFAIINVVTFIGTAALGRRTVVKKITFGWLGKRKGSPHWVPMALLFTSISLTANAVNAVIIKSTPGFASVSVAGLVLLWCSRPRIAWIGVILISVQEEEAMYFSTGISAVLSEIVLQSIGAVYLGLTANFARNYGFYLPSEIGYLETKAGMPDGTGSSAHLMYSGALLWCVFIGLVYGIAISMLFGVGKYVMLVIQYIKRGLIKMWRICSRTQVTPRAISISIYLYTFFKVN